jgi:hypothetical protein
VKTRTRPRPPIATAPAIATSQSTVSFDIRRFYFHRLRQSKRKSLQITLLRNGKRRDFPHLQAPRISVHGSAHGRVSLQILNMIYSECIAIDAAAVTVQTLKWRLVRPLDEFGDVKLSDLRAGEIAAWEATLPPRFRYAVVRTLRQVLDAAVAWEYLARNSGKATGKIRPLRSSSGSRLNLPTWTSSRESSVLPTARRSSSGHGASCGRPSSWRSSVATSMVTFSTFVGRWIERAAQTRAARLGAA